MLQHILSYCKTPLQPYKDHLQHYKTILHPIRASLQPYKTIPQPISASLQPNKKGAQREPHFLHTAVDQLSASASFDL